MWGLRRLNLKIRNVTKNYYAFYSRRSDSKNADSYKIVKHRKSVDDFANSTIGTSPNWELLAPRGYRFYLPGSIGPAWHDSYTTAHLEEFRSMSSHRRSDNRSSEHAVECVAQECPLLLRRGIMELFSGTEFGASELTVVTISQKAAIDLSCSGKDVENEREKLTKFFVLAAQEICMKLRLAGYWADFINPFSGRPYLTPIHPLTVHETNEKSHYLDFHINDSGNCKVISKDLVGSRDFTSSLFTTAPASTSLLKDILEEYD